MSKRLSTYSDSFDYDEKLSVSSGSISIVSFATVISAPVGIASASFSFIFSITTGIVKELLKITWIRKKKYNKIVMLARGIIAQKAQYSKH